MAVGDSASICFGADFMAARARDSEETGDTDNVVDLQNFLDTNPGIDAALELDDASVEALFDAWGTDEATNLGFRQSYACADSAMKLMATVGTLVAAASYI